MQGMSASRDSRKQGMRTQIILLAHSELGRAYLAVAQAMTGSGVPVKAIDLSESSAPATIQSQLVDIFRAGNEEGSYLVLVDIYGGTPWRIASQLADTPPWRGRVAVASGMNLAMVLEACVCAEHADSLSSLAHQVLQAAESDIRLAPDGII